MKIKRLYKKECGLTVLEMLASIAIIILLASLLLTAASSSRQKAFQAKCINL